MRVEIRGRIIRSHIEKVGDEECLVVDEMEIDKDETRYVFEGSADQTTWERVLRERDPSAKRVIEETSPQKKKNRWTKDFK